VNSGELAFALQAEHPVAYAEQWTALDHEAGGRCDATPLSIKAAYVYGVIHDICESVQLLLKAPSAWPVPYLPAFGVCAAGIELLGRCIKGAQGSQNATPNLMRRLEWLIEPSMKKPSARVVVKTNYREYLVDHLIALRHFAAHGQAIADLKKIDWEREAVFVEIELLDRFPKLIGDGIESYYACLQDSSELHEKLAQAGVAPLRWEPIRKTWKFFSEGKSPGQPFYGFDWQVYKG
jgi:hypothetical protein